MKMEANLKQSNWTRRDAVLVFAIILGLTSVVMTSHWIDARRPPVDPALEEERLYVNGQSAKRLSFGFNGLLADWYWMRSLQYVGRKIISLRSDVPLDDLGSLNLKLLAPLLDTSTALDPIATAISDYNTFVNTAANAAGSIVASSGATWSVIASTYTVSALTNIGGSSSVPIYLLNGTRVATGTAELFSGNIEECICEFETGVTFLQDAAAS